MALIQDRSSREWMQVKEFCETRLKELQEENELDLGEIDTAKVRGKIELIREILDLEQDSARPEIPNTRYLR